MATGNKHEHQIVVPSGTCFLVLSPELHRALSKERRKLYIYQADLLKGKWTIGQQ